MPQEEFDSFPQRRLAELCDGLRMFLDREVQRVIRGENPLRCDEAFQFRSRHRFDRNRVI